MRSDCYTVELARLYEGQGYLLKAKDCYGHLLADDPGNPELKESLRRVDAGLESSSPDQEKNLETLAREWAELVVAKRRLDALTSVREGLM